MARHRGAVLVDTNVILEAHRVSAWRALVGGYRVETVEECVTETQTGFPQRPPSRRIEEKELRTSLGAVHSVGNRERADLAVRVADIALDAGEASLWAHALSRDDAWVLCGPDKASLRCGVRLRFRERLAPLESLLDGAGFRSSRTLRRQYTKAWHERVLGEIVLAERGSVT